MLQNRSTGVTDTGVKAGEHREAEPAREGRRENAQGEGELGGSRYTTHWRDLEQTAASPKLSFLMGEWE